MHVHLSALTTLRIACRLAWRNVLRNARHSIATTLAIAAGFAAVALFDGFLSQVERSSQEIWGVRGMLGDVIIEHGAIAAHRGEEPWEWTLDSTTQKWLDAFLRDDPSYVARTRFLDISGVASSGSASTLFLGYGYDVAAGREMRGAKWAWDAVAGRPLEESDQGMLVGLGLGRVLGCATAQPDGPLRKAQGGLWPVERAFSCAGPRAQLSVATEAEQANAAQLPILGLKEVDLREHADHWVSLPLATAQRLFDTDKVTRVSVALDDARAAPAFVARLQSAAQAAGQDLSITPWMLHPLGAVIHDGMEILRVFRNLFLSIVAVMGGMSVANIISKAVHERRREIGMLRSMGYLRADITAMFVAEGVLLACVACVLGLGAALIGIEVIGRSGLTFQAGFLTTPIALALSHEPATWGITAGALTCLAGLTAWMSARRAAAGSVAAALSCMRG